MNDLNKPNNERNQKAACAETRREKPKSDPDILLEPVTHGRHRNNGGASSGAKTEEQERAIKHEERLGIAKKNESQADADYPTEDKSPGAEAINKESYQRGKNPHLQTPQAGREGNLGITPAELLDQRVDKGGKPEKENAAYI